MRGAESGSKAPVAVLHRVVLYIALHSALEPVPMSHIGRSARIFQAFAICYIAIGAVYTADRFILGPLLNIQPKSLPFSWLDIFSESRQHGVGNNGTSEAMDRRHPLDLLKSTQHFVSWHSPGREGNRFSVSSTEYPSILVSEDLFLSKVFSQSMHPSKIVPFFYRASGDFDKEDITITTLVTSNRFKVFAALAKNYQGISTFAAALNRI